MANVPVNLSMAIVLDKSGSIPAIRITDTSPWGGLSTGVTGIVTILQPDGLSFNGSFSSPDIYYLGGSLFGAQKELRLANDSNFQKGVYTISYTARLAGYTDTTITQSFTIDYSRPNGVITPNIDVFTPVLTANDTTNYVVNNFSLQSVVRNWMLTSTPGMTVGGNAPQFNLNIAGSYYDAAYAVSLFSVITYLLTNANNVSIIDKMEVDSSFSTVIPDSLNTLFAAINTYKANLTSVGGTCKDDYLEKRANYQYAYTLFTNYLQLGTCGYSKNMLVDLYNELKATLNNNTSLPYTPTNAVIPTYNFGAFCGIGTVSLPLVITAQPQPQAKFVGQSLTLTVAASGTAPLTYQWRKNGNNIGGATSASYTIGSLVTGDTGIYDVSVTDGLTNQVSSIAATVTVTVAPTTFSASWTWVSTDPYAALQSADTLTYVGNAVFTSGQSVVADFRSAPNLQYLVLKVPVAEPVKTIWNNTGSNNGNIPDPFVWRPSFVLGGFRYYVTTKQLSLDPSATTIFS